MALTVKVYIQKNGVLRIRNKGNTVWNERLPSLEEVEAFKDEQAQFYRAHLIQNPDMPQGKEIVLDEELEDEEW